MGRSLRRLLSPHPPRPRRPHRPRCWAKARPPPMSPTSATPFTSTTSRYTRSTSSTGAECCTATSANPSACTIPSPISSPSATPTLLPSLLPRSSSASPPPSPPAYIRHSIAAAGPTASSASPPSAAYRSPTSHSAPSSSSSSLSNRLGWLPVSGAGTGPILSPQFFFYLILPAITLGMGLAGILTRMVRTAMLEELNQDYIRTARAKGLSGAHRCPSPCPRQRPLIPVLTIIGLQFGSLLAGVPSCYRDGLLPGPASGRLPTCPPSPTATTPLSRVAFWPLASPTSPLTCSPTSPTPSPTPASAPEPKGRMATGRCV